MTRRQSTIIEPDGEWLDGEDDELPPRPRNRLLRPLPIALIAVLIAALGFLAGVLVQKGSGSGSSFGGAATFSKGAATAAKSASTKGATGTSAGGSSSAISGTVSSIKGGTLYVKDSEGAIIEVKAEAGSTVTRDAKTTVAGIHPGDKVVIDGDKSGAKVKASSIEATQSGVETTTSFAPGGAPSGSSSSKSGSSTAESSLFGE